MGKTDVLQLVLWNKTNEDFTLQNRSAYTFYNNNDLITVKPGEENILEVKTKERLKNVNLSFEVLNGVNAPGKHPIMKLEADITQ